MTFLLPLVQGTHGHCLDPNVHIKGLIYSLELTSIFFLLAMLAAQLPTHTDRSYLNVLDILFWLYVAKKPITMTFERKAVCRHFCHSEGKFMF